MKFHNHTTGPTTGYGSNTLFENQQKTECGFIVFVWNKDGLAEKSILQPMGLMNLNLKIHSGI